MALKGKEHSLSEIVVSERGAVQRFEPEGAGIRAAALASAVQHAKNVRKWEELWPAVDKLIAEQEQVVAWWEKNVRRPGQKANIRDRGYFVEEAEKKLGVTAKQVSRWRSRLKRADEYRNALYGAAYKKAMAATAAVHVENNSGENEWYTPPDIIERARRAMGGIDCDPASNPRANAIVQAEVYYTQQENGLRQQWHGRVWMNPPYVQPLCAEFCAAVTAKAVSREIDQACVLVNNATETAWFQTMLQVASAICLPSGRVRFLDKEGHASRAPLQGQAVLYFGEFGERFADEFKTLGTILVPHRITA